MLCLVSLALSATKVFNMHLYIYLFLETCYTCTVLTCTGGVATPKCSVLLNQIPCQRLLRFSQEPNKPHPMIDIYRAFGFLIITIEWMVWLRNYFTGIILTHEDTFQPIFSKIRKINKWSLVVHAPMGAPLISQLNCTWPNMNHKPQKDINNTRYHHWLFNEQSVMVSGIVYVFMEFVVWRQLKPPFKV